MNSASNEKQMIAVGLPLASLARRARVRMGGVLGAGILAVSPAALLAGQADVAAAAGNAQASPATIDQATIDQATIDQATIDQAPIDPAARLTPTADSDMGADDSIAEDAGLAPLAVAPPPSSPANRQGVYGPVVIRGDTSNPNFTWSEPPPQTPAALVDAISIATQKDPSVLAAWLAARAALQDVKGAQWLRFPALSSGLVFYNRSSQITEQIAPQVTVQLPLFTGGRIGATINRAKAVEQAAIARWREVVLEIAQQVSDSYYGIVLSTRLEGYYKESLAAHQKLVETIRRRVEQEVSPEADLQLALSRTAQIEQELFNIQAQRLTALRTIAELVRDANFRLGPVPTFDLARATQSWDNVVAEAVTFSPTRERLQYTADAARQEVKISRGSIFPQVNGQYSYSDFVGSRLGIGLQLQTANGLSQFSAVAAANARANEATQQVGLAVRQLKQQVEVQKVTQEAAVRRAKVSAFASDTAGKVSESYVRQFIAGRRSWLDVLNSLREHLSNQANVTQAEVTAQSSATRLNLVSGRWRLVHVEPVK